MAIIEADNKGISDYMEDNQTQTPYCTHPESGVRFHFSARDPVTGEWFNVGYCQACKLHATYPQPSPDEIGRYYPPAYYGSGKRYLGPIEGLLNLIYELRLKRVVGDRPPGRALDIGCGRGILLAKLRERGWEVEGTELSGDAARYARETLGLKVEAKSLQELHYPDRSFDLIILWHVLEHLHDPQAMLAEIHRILKPDGLFLVAVPNFGSWEARMGKRHWFHLNVPGHLLHFTKGTIERDLRRAGFIREHRTFFSSEYDFFSFVQTVQNRLGLRFNLLYDLLRRRTAQFGSPGGDKPAGPAQKLLALALAAPLGLVSLAYAPIAALLRQGATVQIIARKQK